MNEVKKGPKLRQLKKIHTDKTTTTSATTSTSAATDDPGACPYVSLKTLCIGWVRGRSKKLHVLAKVGGVLADGTEVPINGAEVIYSTTVDEAFNTRVTTTTGDYVFGGYQDDFEATCFPDGEPFAGATGNANCFETAPQYALCEVTVTGIKHPDPACLEVPFDAADSTGSCVFAGKNANTPCAAPEDI